MRFAYLSVAAALLVGLLPRTGFSRTGPRGVSSSSSPSPACPAAQYSYGGPTGGAAGDTASAQFQASYRDGWCQSCTASLAWDLVAGTFSTTSTCQNVEYCGDARLDLYDDYVVSGPPAGSPVTLTAKLNLSEDNFGYVVFEEVGGQSVTQRNPGPYPDHYALQLALEELSGKPFRLHTYSAEGNGNSGTLSFFVPKGVTLTSCYGYAGSVITSARAGTWGALRQRYH